MACSSQSCRSVWPNGSPRMSLVFIAMVSFLSSSSYPCMVLPPGVGKLHYKDLFTWAMGISHCNRV